MKQTARILTLALAISAITPAYPIEMRTWRYLTGFGAIVGALIGAGIYKKQYDKAEDKEKEKTKESIAKGVGSACIGALVGGLGFALWFYGYRPDARLAKARELINSARTTNRLQNFIDDSQLESRMPQPVQASAPALYQEAPMAQPVQYSQEQAYLQAPQGQAYYPDPQRGCILLQIIRAQQPDQHMFEQPPMHQMPAQAPAAQQPVQRRTTEEIACDYFRHYPMVAAEENMHQATERLEQAQRLCADAAEDIVNEAHWLTRELEITRNRAGELREDARRFGREIRMHYRYENEVANERAERLETRRVAAEEERARARHTQNALRAQALVAEQQARLAQQNQRNQAQAQHASRHQLQQLGMQPPQNNMQRNK